MEVKLEVVKGPDQGRVFVLREPTTCLAGRSREARFRFSEDDPYISRRHFLLEAAPPKVYFRDLDVTNPSKINGHYVDEKVLEDGDIIQVGYTRLKVSLNMDLATEIVHCKKCGLSFEICQDESPGQVCANCLEELTKKRLRQADAGTGEPEPGQVRCQCGRDLSAAANSDGRARELRGKVAYTCETCVSRLREEKGQTINGYEIIRFIGKGGMGSVSLAYHRSTARLVALKEMNIFNKQLTARFAREIRIMKKVAHNNVLFYIDSGIEIKTGGSRPYLVMEYASHGCLDDLLKEHETTPARRAVQLIIQSLEGLQHVHQAGIIHRDLKPENILLKPPDGQGLLTPKIADFGLAREFSKAGGSVLTQLGTALGTILYMPPEQIKNAHSVKEPADLYSMGVTLYYLLTARYPFNFPSPMEVRKFMVENRHRVKSSVEAFRMMAKVKKLKLPHLIVLSEASIPIRERKPDLPSRLARVVDKAISKNIEQRYQTAAEFKHALESAGNRL